ncbi:MAG TPA: nucleoside diphosphate kinase regulator [Polyangiales bacterium]
MTPLRPHIVLTTFDHNRLQGLLQLLRARSAVNPWSLDALELELARAEVVAPERVPGDVITMNSWVELRDLATSTRFWVRLVFPGTGDTQENGVPVLSPLGIALLGCRAGQVLQWDTEAGSRRLSIDSVTYQPEAAGDFHV